MKKTILSLAFILFATVLVAQPAGKWSTGGNAISSGDFIGTTNNFPFDFRVNNVQQMSIGTNGVLTINSLIGTGTRILLSDANGNISALPQGGPDEFLLSNGTWGSLPVSATVWKSFGNDISYLGGNLGIGTSSPSYKLDVLGDARVSNNLYVGGGIIVTDKLDATVEVKAGDVIVNNELQVNGNSKIVGQLTASQGVLFDSNNSIGLKYTAGNVQGSGTYILGDVTKVLPVPCAATSQNNLNIGLAGNVQIFDPSSISSTGLLNLQSWNNGTSSIDASVSGNAGGGLLINYFCGSNTFINTASGIVHLGTTRIGSEKIALGPHTNAKLTVDGKVVVKSLYVTQQNWADYVFDKGYKLPAWEETEKYFIANKHLKDVPSEKEIVSYGNNLGETDAVLLRKIEEAYLYIGELFKQVDELKKLNHTLETKLKSLNSK